MSNLAVVNRPFGTRADLSLADGLTILEMMEASGITGSMQRRAQCWLADPVTGREDFIRREFWSRVRPKPGVQAVLRVFPGKGGGGGGKSILGIVLSIAVMAAAAFAGAAIAAAPALIGALGASGAGILGGLASGVIGIPGKYYKGASAR